MEVEFKNLGEKIRHYRIQKNISQEELARIMKCQQSKISYFEKNMRVPSPEVGAKLYEALGIPKGYEKDREIFMVGVVSAADAVSVAKAETPAEKTKEIDTEKLWYVQLKELIKKENFTQVGFAKIHGIKKSTLEDWLAGKVKNVGRIREAYRINLYKITGLECFSTGIEAKKLKEEKPGKPRKYVPQGMPEGISKKVAEELSRANTILSEIEQHLKSVNREQAEKADADYHAQRAVSLLEALADEVDFFRTAKKEAVDIFVQMIKENADTYRWVDTIINNVHKTDKAELWLRMSAQPPHKLKRIK